MTKARELPRGISRQEGHYRVRLFVDGRQHSLGMFESLDDARAALDIARSEKARGIFVPPAEKRAQIKAEAARRRLTSITFGKWAEQWLERMEADPHLSPASVVTHRSVLRVHVLPSLADLPLTEITEAEIGTLITRVRAIPSKRNPGQPNGITPNVIRTLSACLNAAVNDPATALTVSPMPKNIAGTRRRGRDAEHVDSEKVATPTEVARMAEAMPARWRVGVLLAAWCGLRLGEVLGLERRDLAHLTDPERAVVHVRRQVNSKMQPPTITDPKSGSTRTLAIPAFLLSALTEHLRLHTDAAPAAPLLPGARPGQRVSQTAFDKAWRTARDAARPGFRFHDLRHTGLTRYAQQGATLAELLHRGGHTDVSVALRYQHATAERDRALTARLNAAVTDL